MSEATAASIVQQAGGLLEDAGVSEAALDARLLLQHVLAVDHAGFISTQKAPIGSQHAEQFQTMLQRRIGGEPVHRIVGRREFLGLSFAISPAVLDPRPETELLVEGILEDYGDCSRLRFADLGTGSGAIAVSLLRHLRQSTCVGFDLSARALDIARNNAEAHGVGDRLELLLSDYLSAAAGQFDFMVSNPPYIRSDEIAGLPMEVRDHDPVLALDGGGDGLAAYRTILKHAARHLKPAGRLYLECGDGQEPDIRSLAGRHDWEWVRSVPDLSGITRVVVFRLRGVNGTDADL